MTKISTRVHIVFLFVLTGLALLAEPVAAQSRGRSRGRDRTSPFRILFDTDNRDEWNLSDEQIDRLEKLQEELQSSEQERDRPDFRNFPQDPEERAKFFAEFRKQQEARNSAALKKIQEVLKEDQYRRLEQLRFQSLGIRALGMEAVAADLKLTDQQQDELSKLLKDYQSARMNFRASREEREKATEELERQILAVLSEDQKAAWQAKLGPPADDDDREREQPAQNTAETNSSGRSAQEATYSQPEGDGPVVVSLEGSEEKADSEKSAKSAATGRTETIQFHLENAPWEMVLKRFADKAGLTLQMIDVPPGSLTYTNDQNWYSPTEALDILHGYLLQKGFVMIKRDRFLVVLDIDKGPIPPNLIPNISIDELENGDHGKHELLTVVLPLQGADADDAAREVESLKGPQGKVVPLSVSNSLVVTDTYSNLQRIHNLLKGVTNVDPEELQFKSFPLDHVLAEEAAIIVRGQLGLDLNPSSSSDRNRFRFSFGRGRDRDRRSRGGSSSSDDDEPPDARVSPDARTNRLLVTGTANQLAIAEQVLDTIDIEADPRTDGRPYLHVYHLKLADTDEVRDTLDVLFPGLVVGEDEDRDGGRLHVKANARQHQQIAEEIAKMDGSSSLSSTVLPVNSHDPLGLASTLNSMFAGEDYPPTIMADSAGRRLLVRGSNDQVTEIRKFLSDLGENGTGAGSQNADRSPFRRKSLGGRDAEEFARILEQVWGRQSARPVNVVIPSNNPIRDRVVPSLDDQTRSPFLENLNPSTSRPPKASETEEQKSTSLERDPLYPVSLQDAEAETEPAEAETPADAKEQESPEPKMPSSVTLRMTQNGEMLLNGKTVTPIGLSKFAGEWLQAIPEEERKFVLSTHPETSTADSFRVLGIVQRSGIDPTLKTSELDPSEPKNNARSPKNANDRQSAAPRREQPSVAANSKPLPITMTVRGGELMLYDPTGQSESLDEMESLIEQLALAIPPRTTWTVYYLRSAEATETATMLEQLFPASSVGTGNIAEDTTFMGQLSGGVASLGNSLMDASGLDSISQDSSVLRIIPEVRSNSLFVSGPVDQVNQVEQMLRVLDADELPETLRERVPRMIPVDYANVNEVATIVKDVYKDFLQQDNGRDRNRRNPLEVMMGGGRSRGNNGRGNGNGNGGPSNVRMTIGVDAQTSKLVVSANDSLFQQVKEMVEDLDEAAKQARRTVQVVNVNEADSVVLQQALQSLLPSVSVSSTGSDSSSSRGDSSSSSRGFGSFGGSSNRPRSFDRSRGGSRDSSSSSSRSGSDNRRSRFGNSGGGSSDRSRFRGFNRGGNSSRGESSNRGGRSGIRGVGGRRGR